MCQTGRADPLLHSQERARLTKRSHSCKLLTRSAGTYRTKNLDPRKGKQYHPQQEKGVQQYRQSGAGRKPPSNHEAPQEQSTRAQLTRGRGLARLTHHPEAYGSRANLQQRRQVEVVGSEKRLEQQLVPQAADEAGVPLLDVVAHALAVRNWLWLDPAEGSQILAGVSAMVSG